MNSPFKSWIRIRGASLHNLKSVNADFPVGGMTALCGPSGSGKSTLALGTLHAESRRRYLETLNPYIAQLAGTGSPVPVDSLEGIRPSVAFESGAYYAQGRTSVGSITECEALIRAIWVKHASLSCEQCHRELRIMNAQGMVETISQLPEGSRIQVMAPLQVALRTLELISKDLLAQGFTRLYADGVEYLCAELDSTAKGIVPNQVSAIVDRLVIRSQMRSRLADSIDTALRIGQGALWIQQQNQESLHMSLVPRCPEHGLLLGAFEANLFSSHSLVGRCPQCEGRGFLDQSHLTCPSCQGYRLKSILLHSTWQGLSWLQILNTPLQELAPQIMDITQDLPVVFQASIRQLQDRFNALDRLGLSHLSLGRSAVTLSDGELLRLRLVPLAGGHLSNLVFILDEPGSGLHPKDCERVLLLLKEIQARDNTIILIEHQPWLLKQMDWLIEMGPGAGEFGGQVLLQGPPQEILNNSNSPTGQWIQRLDQTLITQDSESKILNLDQSIQFSTSFRTLKNLHIQFPVGALTVVCGVSGSGKSTLVFDVLANLMEYHLNQTPAPDSLGILHYSANVKKVILVDSKSLRSSKRSTLATVIDVLTPLRQLFAATPSAKAKGFSASRFSPNVAGGRCESCQGLGILQDPTQYGDTLCHVCLGRRFRDEILEVRVKTLNISEVLDLTVSEALRLFTSFTEIQNKLKPLQETGLGYLRLGQSTAHCSAGELQRLKLSLELQESQEHGLYLFDEPARGLHQQDIAHLLQLFKKMTSNGHTLVVIEHQPAFCQAADKLIELGPGPGQNGGSILAQRP